MSAGVTIVSSGAPTRVVRSACSSARVEHRRRYPRLMKRGDEGEVLLETPVDASGGDEVVGIPCRTRRG